MLSQELMALLPGSGGLLLSEVRPAGLSTCLLKLQRHAVSTADSHISYIMSGEHFDVLVERLQHHFMISVEVTVCLSALRGVLKGFTYWGLALFCQGCSLSNVFACCLHLLSTQ